MSSPIKDVLQALSRHSEVIESGLTGVVSSDSGTPAASIAALRQASALRPIGDDGYRLHPRLRDYLQDHLQLFPAFQSFADIGSKISQVSALWNEIERERLRVDEDTVNEILESLQATVFDIVDSMNSNMLYLQTLISTRYGNVASLESKKSQNRYYQQQTAMLAADLQRLARVCDIVERESTVRGMEDLARFIRRGVQRRVTPWQQGVSEMQTHLRKEIYSIREVERNHMLLARTDMMLRQQPGFKGIDADLDGDIPDFLLAAFMPAFVAHSEPLEALKPMREEMEALARALPPKKDAAPDPEPPKRYVRIVDPPSEVELSPSAMALNRLFADVDNATTGLSLMDWWAKDENAKTLDGDVWLVFSVLALRGGGLRVDTISNAPKEGERFSHTFRDGLAYGRNAVVAHEAY